MTYIRIEKLCKLKIHFCSLENAKNVIHACYLERQQTSYLVDIELISVVMQFILSTLL